MVCPRRSNLRRTLACSLLLLLPGMALAVDPDPTLIPTPTPTPAPLATGSETFAKVPDAPVDPAKEKTLYAVGYAHLDTQWRWSYPQVIREFVASTLHDNFKLLDKYPNYVFNFSGSRRYEMMREYYPADYEKLKGYVAAGRWFPCGSSVDEGDANVPGLEAMVRHVLYGNHYFQKEFGVTSHEFMLPDCFGFPASLPSILAHCSLKGFSTQKLTWGSAVGIPFKVGRWIGPDGKNVVAALDPGAYTGKVTEDLSRSAGWLQRIEKTGGLSGAFVDYHYFGTGDRGGAPSEDSVRWIERSVAGKGPVHVVSSTAQRMFDDLQPAQIAKLPEYTGELLLTEHSSGSITSASYMKRWNRKNELLADAAERASVLAMTLGGAPYPAQKLYEAWDLVLGSQMHDMLPGTSLPKAYEYCWNDDLLAANQFAAVETDAVGTVASALDTQAQGVPLVVYNPLSHERDDVVEANVTFPGDAPAAVAVFGPDGQEIPAQIDGRAGHTARVLFSAHVPSVGFAAYDVRPAVAINAKSALKVSDRALENERYRVTLNDGGNVTSIFDKTNGEELLAAPARLEFHYEKPRQFPAWNMDWADRKLPPKAFVDGPAKFRVVENGPVRVALEVEREAQGSRFVQTIRLATGGAGDRVEFANVIDWQSRESSLKASFPFKNASPQASYDDKLGVVVRGNNDPKKYEVPQHQWFDMTNGQANYGAAVLNDCKFGSDKPDDQTLRLTLLYTPGVRGDYQDQAVQDFGRNEMLYAVAGHRGDWRAGGVPLQAARLNQPLAAFQAAAHAGGLGRSVSLLKIDSEQVAVVAIKKAEDSDEIVVRLKETTGRAADHVRVSGIAAIAAAREVDGQEREIGRAALQDGALLTDLGPFGLRAFALKLAPGSAPLAPPKSQPVALAYDLDAVSTQANRADGGFDQAGRTYPAEQLPATLVGEGIDFRLGPTADGQKNALACHGQTVTLPAGDFDHVYLLAAAADGDARGTFKIGDRAVEQTVQDWAGYVGQWDNRLWKGPVPELTYSWSYEWIGLTPGYTKRDTVAWYASHRHHPQDGNEFYQYCYLFKYGFELPAGARTITLPDNPRIRVFAVSVAQNGHEGARPARPLYDTLEHEGHLDAPRIVADGARSDDGTTVSLEHPLYWNAEGWHYTVDGSEPTAQSPVYQHPLRLHAPTTVRARMFGPQGDAGPEARTRFEVNDTAAPRIVSATSPSTVPQVVVHFSEPLRRDTAETPGNYRLTPPVDVLSARLSEDGASVSLALAQPLPAGGHRLTVDGVEDLAPVGNRVKDASTEVAVLSTVYTLDSMVCDGNTSRRETVPGLPTGHADPWTINMYVRTDRQPANHTVIAGFGAAKDETGHGRYLSKFANGIHFWCADSDLDGSAPLSVGQWQMLTATYDGHTLTLYKDAKKIGQGSVALGDDEPVVEIAPLDPWDQQYRFAGEIRQFAVWNSALTEPVLRQLYEAHP